MARPDREVADLIQGLETICKVFLGNTMLTGDARYAASGSDRGNVLRAAKAYIPQQDESFYKVLNQIVPALEQLQVGQPELAEKIVAKVGQIEAGKREATNWAMGNNAHHVAELIGQNMAVGTLPMQDAMEALSIVNKTVPMGNTPGSALISLTQDEHMPIAHFDQELNAPNQHGISEIKVARDVLSKNPSSVQQVVDLYTSYAVAEAQQSKKPLNMEEGKAVRRFAAQALGITTEQLQSTDRSPNQRIDGMRTIAEKNLEALRQKLGDSAIQDVSSEIYGSTEQARSQSQGERALERKMRKDDIVETSNGTEYTRNNLDRPAAFSPVSKNTLANPGDLTFENIIHQVRPGELNALRRLGLRI